MIEPPAASRCRLAGVPRTAAGRAMFHLFHHIPKSAGTSCVVAMASLAHVVRDYHASTSQADLLRYDAERVDLSRLTPADILCGHWNLPGRLLLQRYPDLEARAPRKITFIREPLAMARSGVRYGIQQGWYREGAQDRALVGRAAYCSTMLACDEDNFRGVIDGYWFVGITEHLQEGFDQLATRMGRPAVQLPRVNTTDGIDVVFSDDAIAEFKARSRVDYLIHAHATVLHRQRSAIGA